MNKDFMKIIEEEVVKIEHKHSIPMDIDFEDIYDDENPEMDVSVELAYNCMQRLNTPNIKKDYFCPKCRRHMSFHTTNLNGERVYACPFEKHMYTEKRIIQLTSTGSKKGVIGND